MDATPPSSEEMAMASSTSSEELQLMTRASITPGGKGALGDPLEPYHSSSTTLGSADRGVSLRPPFPHDDEAPLFDAPLALIFCGRFELEPRTQSLDSGSILIFSIPLEHRRRTGTV